MLQISVIQASRRCLVWLYYETIFLKSRSSNWWNKYTANRETFHFLKSGNFSILIRSSTFPLHYLKNNAQKTSTMSPLKGLRDYSHIEVRKKHTSAGIFFWEKYKCKSSTMFFLLKDILIYLNISFIYIILNFHEILLLTKENIGLDMSRVFFLSINWLTFPRRNDASGIKIQIDFKNK